MATNEGYRTMKALIILFVLVIMSYEGIGVTVLQKANAEALHKSHYIDKKEAVSKAKQFLRENGLEADYFPLKYKVKLKEGVWYVVFLKRPKVKTLLNVAVSLRVGVDQLTGGIRNHIIQKGYYVP